MQNRVHFDEFCYSEMYPYFVRISDNLGVLRLDISATYRVHWNKLLENKYYIAFSIRLYTGAATIMP